MIEEAKTADGQTAQGRRRTGRATPQQSPILAPIKRGQRTAPVGETSHDTRGRWVAAGRRLLADGRRRCHGLMDSLS